MPDIRSSQPIPPRFFIVIGTQTPPWRMVELDIDTAKRIGEDAVVDAANFDEVWNRLGLKALRGELRNWISAA